MGGYGDRDEGVDEQVPPGLPDPDEDPVRRLGRLRSRAEAPKPEQARFADRIARAISAPSGGRVPTSRRPTPLPVEAEPVDDGDAEAGTEPGTVQVVAPPEQYSGPHLLPPAEITDPGVPPTVRDAAFGPPPVEVVPLPTAPSVVCDARDRILRVNPAFLRLAAHHGPDPIGLPLDRILSGPDADARLRRADGVTVRVRVVRWALPGGLEAVLFVEQPEPDRRWTAELERMARVGTWGYDLATATLRRSPSLDRLYAELGVRPDGPLGPIEGEQVAALCRALRAGEVPEEQQVELRVGGGGARGADHSSGGHVLTCRARVERGPDGRPLRLAGMVRDVTPEQPVRPRSDHAAERFAALMATVADGVALFDASGRLTDANPTFCRLLDRPLEDLRSRTALALSADATPQPDTGAAELPIWLRRIAPGGEGYRLDAVRFARGDGTTLTCRVGVSASLSDDGDPFWLVTATRPERPAVPAAMGDDDLTGLLDRAGAVALLADLLAGAGHDRVAVVCGDLDDFARVNSSLGHDAGDDLLVETAERLRRGLPASCTAARLSADQFAVLCADHALTDGPEALAHTVAGLLRATAPVHGATVRITASVGVVTPDVLPDGETDLLRYAEVAMQHAKRTGRGEVVVATASVVAAADQQLELEAELRAALADDQLVLEYQPVVGPDGTVLSAEALVRWRHPERGTVSPGEFLPVAERAGMMRELDLWVLRTAVREAADWPAPAAVAVNLAGLLPSDPLFLAEVTAAVEAAGLGWNRLILELVETSLVELPQSALDAMAELVGLGVRFAVDDFGTGYSSLARLKQLPAQTVKVDRAFVTGVAADPADFAVARAVVDMARALGRTTVAEGVETAEQFHVLRGLGVDAYQGWLFARPLEPDALRRTLAGGRLATPARALGA
ncbi:putative bifunctional diguanylate cyclase/phosphodiesterase [Pseudonocardia oroxyli]|uniref:Diguanylate cyclase (GGDEF) domain-containing protein n=1 Tax=Pseudonocardia oroxyli TaxID=366584 RepID=A0A1G7NGW0_PSEOR|nr:EAL domain-containing protein [Pseudonocardia oroxyli]SDF73151.1 diguanylate cyclase (GGDEF) domain-containing protein [Pseudonocardia oroxyli]